MDEFTSEQTARWNAWQQANAVSARHSDRVARWFAATMLAAAVAAVVIALLG